MAEICGQCDQEFKNEKGYLNHECPETGVKPSAPTPDDDPIAQAARERGEDRKGEKKHPAEGK